MKIGHEIERVGDEAKAIARRSRKTSTLDFYEIPKMGKNCTRDASGCTIYFC